MDDELLRATYAIQEFCRDDALRRAHAETHIHGNVQRLRLKCSLSIHKYAGSDCAQIVSKAMAGDTTAASQLAEDRLQTCNAK